MKVALLTPCYDGRLHADHMESVAAARTALECADLQFHVIHVSGCPILPRARNHLVAHALSIGADQLVFVDSDVGFSPDALARLISHPHAIIGAAPQKHQQRWNEAPAHAFLPFAEPREPDENDVMEVRGVATSFAKIDARVFQAMRNAGRAPAYFLHEAEPKILPHLARFFSYSLVPIEQYDPRPGLLAKLDELGIPPEQRVVDEGEDYFFCRHAREIGFKIWLDTALKIRHWEGRCNHDDSLKESVLRAYQARDVQLVA